MYRFRKPVLVFYSVIKFKNQPLGESKPLLLDRTFNRDELLGELKNNIMQIILIKHNSNHDGSNNNCFVQYGFFSTQYVDKFLLLFVDIIICLYTYMGKISR